MMEEQLRRTMLLSRGDPMVFLERPISATLLAITALIIAFALYSTERNRRRDQAARKIAKERGTTP
jgi:TctA family transporter